MLKNIFAFLLIILFILNINTIFAKDLNTNSLDSNLDNNMQESLGKDYNISFVLNNPKKSKDLFNKHIESVPNFVKKFLPKEKIKLKIKDENGDYSFLSIITENGLVKSVQDQNLSKYTLEIELSRKTANDLIQSKDPTSIFKNAIKSKEIKYKGIGFFNSIKYFFVKLISNLL